MKLLLALNLILLTESYAQSLPKGYRILKEEIGSGYFSLVDLVERIADGQKFVWKRPRNKRKIEGLRAQAQAIKKLSAAGLSTVEADWYEINKSLIMTYIEGPTLAEVLRKNPEMLMQPTHPQHIALVEFIEKALTSGKFINDSRARNIMWDTNNLKWTIVDAHDVSKVESAKELMKHLRIGKRSWTKSLPKNEENYVAQFLERYYARWRLIDCGTNS